MTKQDNVITSYNQLVRLGVDLTETIEENFDNLIDISHDQLGKKLIKVIPVSLWLKMGNILDKFFEQCVLNNVSEEQLLSRDINGLFDPFVTYPTTEYDKGYWRNIRHKYKTMLVQYQPKNGYLVINDLNLYYAQYKKQHRSKDDKTRS